MRARRFPFGIGVILLVLLILVGFLYRQYIVDQFNIWTYQPTNQVKSLASDDDLTDLGQRYLYASRPQVDGRSDFNKYCGEHEPAQTVLGCYTSQRIYIFDVTNSELSGVMQVTAAHEMLHAAYARLSRDERARVDKLLQSEGDKLNTDKTFTDRMKVYNKLPKSEYLDEMHSVIGTEVAKLPNALNEYYAHYFKDRSVITDYYQKYAGVFRGIQDQANALIASLNELANEINSGVKQYNQAATRLTQDISAFNERAARRGGFSSQQDFNAARAALISRSKALDEQQTELNNMIATYHADEDKLNSMEAHLNELNISIDSSLQPVPEVKSGN